MAGSEELPNDLLVGWNEIARYMGRGMRTVQRWSVAYRLPVRRPEQRARGKMVLARREELDDWIKSLPSRADAGR
jgi:hypothetical protein